MRRSIGYGAYGDFGITDEQLQIIGKCPNSQMPCLDPQGNDLWPLVAHLSPEQKATIGRCPSLNNPCIHPPGDPSGVDLWQIARQGAAPMGAAGPVLSAPGAPNAPGAPATDLTQPAQALPSYPAGSLPPVLGPDVQPPASGSSSGMIFGVIALVVFLGIGATAIFVLTGDSEEPEYVEQ